MSYQPPPPYPVVMIQKPPANGPAITGMVFGIIAIVAGIWALVPILGLIAAVLAFVPAVVAVALGHYGLSRSKTMQGSGSGQATAALVLGYITLGILVATTGFWVLVSAGSGS